MAGAIRVISVERGFDPRDFSLVSFGGAGSMHAAALAGDLGIPRVIVPFAAGILSALGMLLADIVRDYSQTLLVAATELQPEALEAEFTKLEVRALEDFALDGLDAADLGYERSIDLRYIGQGYELEVPMQADFEASFHEHHEQRYGYSDAKRPTEVVNVRLRVMAPTQKPTLESEPLTESDSAEAVVRGPHDGVRPTAARRQAHRPGPTAPPAARSSARRWSSNTAPQPWFPRTFAAMSTAIAT